MTRTTSLPLRLAALAALVPALLAVSAGSVSAEPIPEIGAPVTDLTGVLAGSEDEIERQIEETLDEDGVQTWIVFVRTTDDLTATEYVDELAARNSFGGNDAVVLVAIDDRSDAVWVSDALSEIDDAEIDGVIIDALEPRLADGDFAGAAIAAVEALGAANAASVEPPATPEPQPTATPEPGPVDGGGGANGGGGIGLGTILAILAVIGGGWLLVRWWGARRVGEERDRRTGALARDANTALIATDERIRDAGQEIGFVEAQYGASETEPFRAAVAAAREELRAAFAIRQQLDDSEPEDPPTRERLLREIVERTTKANGLLDAQTERVRALRELERDAPRIVEELPGRIDAVEARVPAAEATLRGLDHYAATAIQPVRGNVVEARKGLEGARAATRDGALSLSRNDTARAAAAARTALEGVTGAERLLDAIDRLAATIAAAAERAPLELREAERDVADARTAVSSGDSGSAALVAAAEGAVNEARAALGAAPPDPIAALSAATEAHRRADEALAAVREAAAARERLDAAAASSVRTAGAAVDRAADYIASRRPGVGRAARTRLAEAERHLDDAIALQSTNPQQSMQAAGRAERLANEAYQLAGNDFSSWDQGGPGWGGGARGGGADLAGSILGGILGGILSGGGTGGGGWGGSPWGGGSSRGGGGFPGWGGGGGFGSGGFGGGGFGGGGGGGRSRGGRW